MLVDDQERSVFAVGNIMADAAAPEGLRGSFGCKLSVESTGEAFRSRNGCSSELPGTAIWPAGQFVRSTGTGSEGEGGKRRKCLPPIDAPMIRN